MALTYSAGAGATVTTSLVGATTISTDQSGAASDEVYIGGSSTAVPSNATDYNSNVGSGTGLGDTFVGRLIVVRKGAADQEIRLITAAAFTSRIELTVNEPWDTAPSSTDNYDVCYELGDVTDLGGGGSSACVLGSKTGFWELGNQITIASTGFLQIANNDAMELDDQGSTVAFIIQSGGYFIAGFESAGANIYGGAVLSYNNTTGEPATQVQSGGRAYVYDTLFYGQIVGMQFECANGSDARFYRCKWASQSDELHLYDATIRDCSAGGRGATTDIIRVDAGTDCIGLVVSNVEQLDTVADTNTETVELRDVLFAQVPNYITIRTNKTWNMLNPVWGVVDHDSFNYVGDGTINEKTTVDAVVQTAAGTALQNALINVYENKYNDGADTITDDLVVETTTDASGIAAGSFLYREFFWSAAAGTTKTYSGHALQCGKWLYLPFVAAQSSTVKFDGTIVLASDSNIVQTTQATAITNGSGITWNGPGDTYPSCVIAYTGGSGTLSVGNTVTGGNSLAVGTVTEILSGDSTAGEVHLRTRTGAATFTNGEALTSTGWTGSPVYTANSQQDFSRWIDASAETLQTTYDYLAARQNETTLTAEAEEIWEWCRSAQTQPLYATGSSFYTERSNGLGVAIVNIASGKLDYMTDDAGVVWNPPTSVDLTITVKDAGGNLISGAQVGIFLTSDGTEVLNDVTAADGQPDPDPTWTGTTPVEVKVWARKASSGDTRYKNYSSIQNIQSVSGLTLDITLVEDPNNNATS